MLRTYKPEDQNIKQVYFISTAQQDSISLMYSHTNKITKEIEINIFVDVLLTVLHLSIFI